MNTLKRRIAALESAAKVQVMAFGGLLSFNGRTESIEDAARRAPGPGIYLLLDDFTSEGHGCEIAVNGHIKVLSC